jgi:hypothetical protein
LLTDVENSDKDIAQDVTDDVKSTGIRSSSHLRKDESKVLKPQPSFDEKVYLRETIFEFLESSRQEEEVYVRVFHQNEFNSS